jgi:general secretion pathway protein G
MEILIVLIIIGLLAAIVLPRLAQNIGKGRVQTTKAQIASLTTTVETFYVDVGRYPTEQEGLGLLLTKPVDPDAAAKWKGPYLEKDSLPKDGWGRDYIYTFDEHGRFVVRSLGADGKPGGEGENADLDNRK